MATVSTVTRMGILPRGGRGSCGGPAAALTKCAADHHVARVGIAARLVVRRFAHVGRAKLTAAVVATIDNALADGVECDLRFVIVNGGAAGNVVHVGVVHAVQRGQLPLNARRAQGGYQFTDFDGACFHGVSLQDRHARSGGTADAGPSVSKRQMESVAGKTVMTAVGELLFQATALVPRHEGRKRGVRAA